MKGFARVFVPAGETKWTVIALEAEDLKYWDVQKHAFVLEKGELQVSVGASSADIRLTGTLAVK